MGLSPRQIFYLGLSVVGLVATWTFNLRFMAESGGAFSTLDFVRAAYANNAAASLGNDLLVGVAAFLVWSWVEARRLEMRHWWIHPLLTFAVAFAFAFPLFLFLRDRRLESLDRSAARTP